MDDLKDLLKIGFYAIIICILVFLSIIIFVVLMLLGGIWTNYRLDQSYCTAKVNNQVVYNGRCHYLDIESIGENGNTKHLTIYGDKWKIHPVKQFVNNNITVEEYNKGSENAR